MSDRPEPNVVSENKAVVLKNGNVAPETRRVLDDYLRRISFRSEVFYRGQVCESWSLGLL